MEFTASLQFVAIIAALLAPVIISGVTKFTMSMIMRMVSHEQFTSTIDAHSFMEGILSDLSKSQYYLFMTLVPIIGEVIFRLAPILAIYYFEIPSMATIAIIGLVSSLLYGVVHWICYRSLVLSLAIQGIAAMIWFVLFLLLSDAFSIPVAFIVSIALRLIQSFVIELRIIQPSSKFDLLPRTYYYFEFISKRDIEQEKVDAEAISRRNQQRFEKYIGYEPEHITSG